MLSRGSFYPAASNDSNEKGVGQHRSVDVAQWCVSSHGEAGGCD